MKFATNKMCINLNIGCDKIIEEALTNKFLHIQIDNSNLKKCFERIVPKLSSACFAMRTVTPLMKTDTLKLVYFAYFHSIMSYGVIFWGNLTDSKRVFIIQKKIIRIMAGVKRRVSCRELFEIFSIHTLASEFLLTLLSFVVDDMEKSQTNSDIRSINMTSVCQMLTSVLTR
jgi:hypothetical protein